MSEKNEKQRRWLITPVGLVRDEFGRRALLRGGPATFEQNIGAIVRDFLKIHSLPGQDPKVTLAQFDTAGGDQFVNTITQALLKHGYPKPGLSFCVLDHQIALWVDAWSNRERAYAAASQTARAGLGE